MRKKEVGGGEIAIEIFFPGQFNPIPTICPILGNCTSKYSLLSRRFYSVLRWHLALLQPPITIEWLEKAESENRPGGNCENTQLATRILNISFVVKSRFWRVAAKILWKYDLHWENVALKSEQLVNHTTNHHRGSMNAAFFICLSEFGTWHTSQTS